MIDDEPFAIAYGKPSGSYPFRSCRSVYPVALIDLPSSVVSLIT